MSLLQYRFHFAFQLRSLYQSADTVNFLAILEEEYRWGCHHLIFPCKVCVEIYIDLDNLDLILVIILDPAKVGDNCLHGMQLSE